ncbi:hypothetical protein BW893_18285 [Bacillus wiedmannii]|nr:hypothetical protein BW893_18285 [Bacillus wiedmannii]
MTSKNLTNSKCSRCICKSILRGADVTFVIIFGSAWAKQSTLFSLNSLMVILGFFLIFMPYILNNFGKTGL